ncbi:ABC transporter permease [Acidobacterium sp. S8]|uniref:ABC transporter permease n=1 Tax=Acidobacterium sp. S8 TaxID=1641854 RepID=UPI0020B16DD8|nr:ABC transporter permease [Acidobacterium sp. S8]
MLWKSRKDRLEDEIQTHIDFETQENIEAGMTPEKARHAAMRKFGNVLLAKDNAREIWGWQWLERLWQDVVFSSRILRKSPGYTVVAVLTLALGIGANAAIFSLVHAVLMKNLPVGDAKSLVRIGNNGDCCVGQGIPEDGSVSYFPTAAWQLLKKSTPEFEELAAIQAGFEWRPVTVRRDGAKEARSVMGEFVSGNYFRTFGLQPQAGRLLTDSDDVAGAPMVAIMSYETWQHDYAGNPSIIGSTFWVNTKPVTIAGIAPEGFFGDRLSSTPPEFYFPIETMPVLASVPYVHDPRTQWLYMIGRVKPGVYQPALQEKLSVLIRQYMAANKPYYSGKGKAELPKVHVVLTPGGGGIQNMQESYGTNLRMLMALSGLVLLIACANIANLLLVRGMARKAEVSVRTALGAARGRIIRQLLTESVVLSLVGGMAGLVVAYLGTKMLLALAFPGAQNVPIHASPSIAVLGFACGVSLVTGVLFGVAPAWIAAQGEPADVLRSGSRATAFGASLLQRGLVVLQAALSLVLLIGAGMFSRSLYKLQDTDLKLESTNRYIVHINPQAAGYKQTQVEELYRTIEDRFHGIPGVEKAGISSYTPMEDNNNSDGVQIDGKTGPGTQSSWIKVNSEYFDSVGTHVVMGRGITPQDTSASRPVAGVSRTFVKHLFNPGENPVGHLFGSPGSTDSFQIVGVVEDTVYTTVYWKDHLMYFVPFGQRPFGSKDPIEEDMSMYAGAIVLKTTRPISDMEALTRKTLASINPNLTVVKFETFDQQISDQFSHERLVARLTILFGGLALLLATIGLYGVTAYTVALRTSEIGIRMALGAKRSRVIAMIMRGAMIQAALGLAIGIPTALLCVRFIESQLYDMKGMDVGILVLSITTLVLAACIAGLIPARRAATIDPAQALRME